MNHKPSGLLISIAIGGFIQFKAAEGLSPSTISSYDRILKQWLERQPDIDVGKVTAQDIRNYLTYMRNDYVPQRITGHNDRKLSSKSIRNIYIAFKAFFRWLSDEFGVDNPMAKVPAPKFQEPVIEPFTQQEVEAMLKACEYKSEAKTTRRRSFVMRRPTARRDRGCILVLLDTGLRASELCALKIGDVELKTGRINVKHGREGGAKGGKGRIVYIGKAARRAVWRYLAEREDGEDPEAPLFLGAHNRPLTKNALRLMITQIGKKAGVKRANPHKFRHTFAINYLRNSKNGDIFTLQMLLGHSSLEIVKRYLLLADIDLERAHRLASPADNWRL
ncbi:MAG: tyrosine-type recombinase/integrase [Clostridiaceae bacterium]|nr:tyrosine-type recombinase/integrase [Clostridiaceae bacterium]